MDKKITNETLLKGDIEYIILEKNEVLMEDFKKSIYGS
jgi:hypothetical protein